MKRLSTGVTMAGLVAAVLGAGGIFIYSVTPAVVLGHPDPHGDQAKPLQSAAEVIGGDWLSFDKPLAPTASPTAAPSLPPAPKRTGLWIEAPELQIALPIKQGDGSNHFPYWVALVYPGTAAPGAAGNSFIYAHGYMQMFGGLLFARNGDAIELHDYGTRTVKTFRVSRVVGRVKFNDLSWIFTPSPGPMLTLQTCVDTNPEGDRYIVQAVPN